MTHLPRMTRLSRSASLALALSALAFASAHADDAFGGYLTNQPTAAARAKPLAAPQPVAANQFKLGENNAFGSANGAPRHGGLEYYAASGSYRVASTTPMASGSADLPGIVGTAQDTLARIIHQPGSRPAGW